MRTVPKQAGSCAFANRDSVGHVNKSVRTRYTVDAQLESVEGDFFFFFLLNGILLSLNHTLQMMAK